MTNAPAVRSTIRAISKTKSKQSGEYEDPFMYHSIIANLYSPQCSLLYCRRNLTLGNLEEEAASNSITLAQDGPDKISSFRRVDLLDSAKPKKSEQQYGRSRGEASSVWYCSNCGDGPNSNWNPFCHVCGAQRKL